MENREIGKLFDDDSEDYIELDDIDGTEVILIQFDMYSTLKLFC